MTVDCDAACRQDASKYINLMDRALPMTACIRGEACSCSDTFSVQPRNLPNIYQPYLWGTTEWSTHYHRRNAAESANSNEAYHLKIGPHSIRVRANKWPLYNALMTAGILIRQIRTLMVRLGAGADDSALDPDITRACLRRVGLSDRDADVDLDVDEPGPPSRT